MGGRTAEKSAVVQEAESVVISTRELERISGMAPNCKLVACVLDENGKGEPASDCGDCQNQEINGYGRRLHPWR
jgi:hypothetical protein